MNTNPTANEFRGKAIGATFFAGFGALWLGLSLYIRQAFSTTRITVLVAGTLVLLLGALWVYQQSDRRPEFPEDPAHSRAFHRINFAQWVAVSIVAFTFSRLHMDAYVLSAITAIVGIHLFPLARLYGRPLHLATGAVLVVWASATVLLVPVEHMQGITAMGTGFILWASAAVSLTSAALAARRAAPAVEDRQQTLAT